MGQMLTDASEPVNLLYYGEGGSGKSTALCGLANLGKVLLINAEVGIKRRPLEALGVNVGNIEVFPGPKEQLTVTTVKAELLRVREALDKKPEAYVGVLIDSLTDLYQNLLRQVVTKQVLRAERNGRERDEYMVEQQDYGIMTEQVRDIMRIARDLPCHLGVTALTRRQQDSDGTVSYGPAITPGLQNDLDLWMDIVAHTSVTRVGNDDEYRARFRAEGLYRGKDRFHVLPRGIIDPSFDRIIAYVDGDLTVEDDFVMQSALAKRKALAGEVADEVVAEEAAVAA